MKRRCYLFLHVPKTGGSTFRLVLVNCFGKALRPDYDILHLPYSAEEMRIILARTPQYRALSSHKLTLDLPFDDASVDLRAIAFVREPLARFVSTYFFQRRNPNLPAHPARRYGFEAWVRLYEERYEEIVAGREDPSLEGPWTGQLMHLVRGKETAVALAAVRKRIESGRLILVPLERFDEGLVALEKMFPEDFGGARYAKQVNVSGKEDVMTPGLERRIRALPHVEGDTALCALARESFDSTLAGLFPAEADLQEAVGRLRARCEAELKALKKAERRKRRAEKLRGFFGLKRR